MTSVKIRIINGKKMFQDLVGISTVVDNIDVSFESWDSEYEELLIVIDGNKNGLYRSDEKISLALGEERFVDRIRYNYGIGIIFIDSFSWEETTSNAMKTLAYSGFKNIVGTYDGEIFIENDYGQRSRIEFLSEQEKNFILYPKGRMLLNMDDENIIPIDDIYLK